MLAPGRPLSREEDKLNGYQGDSEHTHLHICVDQVVGIEGFCGGKQTGLSVGVDHASVSLPFAL